MQDILEQQGRFRFDVAGQSLGGALLGLHESDRFGHDARIVRCFGLRLKPTRLWKICEFYG